MTIIQPSECPICHGEWIDNNYASSVWSEYKCSTKEVCQTIYYLSKQHNKGHFYLSRSIGSHVIWWSDKSGCEIEVFEKNKRCQTINAWLPFDIDEKRLKLILLLG